MTNKFQRPAGAYAGASGLANRTKYQDDATATPKRAISSAKVDGDLNYMIDALNLIDEASGARASIQERLDVSINADGTLKASVAGALDEWVVHINPGVMARVDNYTFTMTGDWRGIYQVNRRVKLTIAGKEYVGDVAQVSYAAGVTTLVCIDLLDSNGFGGLIGSVPTQIAYGPLTGGARGNTPRRFDGLKIPAGMDTYELKGVDTDMLVLRNGMTVAAFTEGGVYGHAYASVGTMALDDEVQAKLVPTGVLMPFAGGSAPQGWLLCAGQLINRFSYADLFAAIGTTYGAGDGSTTFAVPDLRGRTVFGLDNMNGTDAGRLSVANTLGGTGGAQTKSGSTDSYTLTIADIPAHTHDINAVSGTASTSTNGGPAMNADAGTGGTRVVSKSVGGGGGHSHGISNFDVLPPYMLLNWMIKV
ncbi:MAG: hypothetical protein DI628_03035 [Blastochloris viridis]|uniref:Phage tail collar domain-containing protein n=1 Tax=Blastochloris viridis TaxID=1079 RepID=A0A6N4RC75_BLAVI|nr:MAG: hypothetical protein DI628_03035 [Blastochloris viridis]